MAKWLTVKEAAAIMSISESYVRQLARKGEVNAQRWGRDWQIDDESAARFRKDARGYPSGKPRTPKNKGE